MEIARSRIHKCRHRTRATWMLGRSLRNWWQQRRIRVNSMVCVMTVVTVVTVMDIPTCRSSALTGDGNTDNEGCY